MNEKILNILREKQAVLFCGAGISLDPPAGLPCWNKLRDGTLEAIASLDRYLQSIVAILLDMEMLSDPTKKGLTPEIVASEIANHSEGYFEIFRSLANGKANANHIYLAMSGFRYIVTTNFDTFIEKAFDEKNIEFKTYRSTEEFLTFNKDDPGVHLFKLHGCISRPSTIIATIEQEAKGLTIAKKEILRYLLERYYFLFWGYSGADLKIDIDYLQMVSCANNAKGFVWNFWQQDEQNIYVNKLAKLYGEKAIITQGKFPQLLHELTQEIEIEKYSDAQKHLWQKNKNEELDLALQKWSNQYLTPDKSCNMLGRLFLHSGKFTEALSCFERCLDICKQPSVEKVEALLNIGVVYKHLEEYTQALTYFGKAQLISEKHLYTKETVASLNNIGVIYGYQNQYEKALRCFKQVKKIAQDNGYEKEVAASLNNIGAIYSKQEKYEKALECYEKAKKISFDIGDRQNFAARLNNIAYVCMQLQKTNEALEYYKQYEEISCSLGDFQGLSIACYNIAMLYTAQNKWKDAKKYYERYENLKKSKS